MITLRPRMITLLLLLGVSAGLWLSLAPLVAQTPPSIISLFPASGPTGGGTNVIIAGSDFTGVTEVTFGGVPAAFSFVSDSTLSATSPPAAAGVVDVAVTTPDGTSPDTADDDYTYVFAGVLILESGGATAVTEGGVTDTYDIVLTTAPSSTVTITIADTPQLDVTPNFVSFAPGSWNIPETVTVSAIDDVIIEGPQLSTITHTAIGGGFSGVGIANVLVAITDNDGFGVTVVESGGSPVVAEGGASDSFTVVLTTTPGATVTVSLDGGTQVTVTPSLLTFSATNWNVPQPVTVTAVDDGLIEGPHSATIGLTVLGTGAVPPLAVLVSIADNNTRRVILSAGGGGSLSFSAIDDTQISEGSPTGTSAMTTTSLSTNPHGATACFDSPSPASPGGRSLAPRCGSTSQIRRTRVDKSSRPASRTGARTA